MSCADIILESFVSPSVFSSISFCSKQGQSRLRSVLLNKGDDLLHVLLHLHHVRKELSIGLVKRMTGKNSNLHIHLTMSIQPD